ncbi:MAG: branched-chain amino acid ABC transporter permease, partial [Opitutaceae bacterium]|nr:branched-chain amino acid ABC transporter permease [Opitutaceae bacterium]
MTEFLQQLLNGFSLGAIYALIALGYTLVYGVLRFINFAHSEVFMVGAFVGCYIGRLAGAVTGWSGLAALASAFLVCGVVVFVIVKMAYRPLRGAQVL